MNLTKNASSALFQLSKRTQFFTLLENDQNWPNFTKVSTFSFFCRNKVCAEYQISAHSCGLIQKLDSITFLSSERLKYTFLVSDDQNRHFSHFLPTMTKRYLGNGFLWWSRAKPKCFEPNYLWGFESNFDQKSDLSHFLWNQTRKT